MLALLASAALFAAEAATVSLPGAEPAVYEEKEVAFDALSHGDSGAAIAQLEARLTTEPNDPALLINLGTAYLKAGKPERAAAAYRAAADSPDRYSLELADGSWIDSRRAALRALRSLERQGAVALK